MSAPVREQLVDDRKFEYRHPFSRELTSIKIAASLGRYLEWPIGREMGRVIDVIWIAHLGDGDE